MCVCSVLGFANVYALDSNIKIDCEDIWLMVKFILIKEIFLNRFFSRKGVSNFSKLLFFSGLTLCNYKPLHTPQSGRLNFFSVPRKKAD